jgi:hypothetical protein
VIGGDEVVSDTWRLLSLDAMLVVESVLDWDVILRMLCFSLSSKELGKGKTKYCLEHKQDFILPAQRLFV